MRRVLITTLTIASIVAVVVPSRVHAIFGVGDITIVSDPQGLIQQIASVAQEAAIKAQLAQQYQQDLLAFAQQAKAFVALPMDIVNQVNSTIQGYFDVLQQARDLTYSITSAVQQFDALYESGWGGNTSFMARAQQLAGTIRSMGRVATQAQSIYERLCATKSAKDLMLSAAQAAPGTLAALQAQAQLTGIVIDQQGTLAELQATQGRIMTGWIMQQTVENEATAAKAEHWLDGWPGTGPTEKVTFGEGN